MKFTVVYSTYDGMGSMRYSIVSSTTVEVNEGESLEQALAKKDVELNQVNLVFLGEHDPIDFSETKIAGLVHAKAGLNRLFDNLYGKRQ